MKHFSDLIPRFLTVASIYFGPGRQKVRSDFVNCEMRDKKQEANEECREGCPYYKPLSLKAETEEMIKENLKKANDMWDRFGAERAKAKASYITSQIAFWEQHKFLLEAEEREMVAIRKRRQAAAVDEEGQISSDDTEASSEEEDNGGERKKRRLLTSPGQAEIDSERTEEDGAAPEMKTHKGEAALETGEGEEASDERTEKKETASEDIKNEDSADLTLYMDENAKSLYELCALALTKEIDEENDISIEGIIRAENDARTIPRSCKRLAAEEVTPLPPLPPLPSFVLFLTSTS